MKSQFNQRTDERCVFPVHLEFSLRVSHLLQVRIPLFLVRQLFDLVKVEKCFRI